MQGIRATRNAAIVGKTTGEDRRMDDEARCLCGHTSEEHGKAREIGLPLPCSMKLCGCTMFRDDACHSVRTSNPG